MRPKLAISRQKTKLSNPSTNQGRLMSDPAIPANQYTEFFQYDPDDTEIREVRFPKDQQRLADAEQAGDTRTAQKLRRLIGD